MRPSPPFPPLILLLGLSAGPLGCSLETNAEDAEELARLRDSATAQVLIAGNLDAREAVPEEPWDIDDPSGTANMSTALDVIDVYGKSHLVELYFRAEGSSTFSFYVLVPEEELREESAEGYSQVAEGTLTFDTDGALKSTAGSDSAAFRFVDTDDTQNVELHFGTPKSDGAEGTDGLTRYALNTFISYQAQKPEGETR